MSFVHCVPKRCRCLRARHSTHAIFGYSFPKYHQDGTVFNKHFLPSSPTISFKPVLRRTMAPHTRVASSLGHDFHFVLRVFSIGGLTQISGVKANEQMFINCMTKRRIGAFRICDVLELVVRMFCMLFQVLSDSRTRLFFL